MTFCSYIIVLMKPLLTFIKLFMEQHRCWTGQTNGCERKLDCVLEREEFIIYTILFAFVL
jgi:hypothetical protein